LKKPADKKIIGGILQSVGNLEMLPVGRGLFVGNFFKLFWFRLVRLLKSFIFGCGWKIALQ
jgi:hypothetical protein